MQKDFHFYLTYVLARKVGIPAQEAEKVAWADQYTDELTKADLHGIQTQSAILGNWRDRQIQMSVLVPFHFPPGDDPQHPWMVTPNSKSVQHATNSDIKNECYLGILLHALQDSFSHQGFSGWEENLNACYAWYYLESALPNIGHAELQVAPDVVNYVWTDPRTGQVIDNKQRAMAAAKATCDMLEWWANAKPIDWPPLAEQLELIFRLASYDRRKDQLRELAGRPKIRYSELNRTFQYLHKAEFIKAAQKHLAEMIKLLPPKQPI